MSGHGIVQLNVSAGRDKIQTNRDLMSPLFECYKLVSPAQPLGGAPTQLPLPAPLHQPKLSSTNCSANRVKSRLYHNYLHTTANGVCWVDATGAVVEAIYDAAEGASQCRQLYQFRTTAGASLDSTSEPPSAQTVGDYLVVSDGNGAMAVLNTAAADVESMLVRHDQLEFTPAPLIEAATISAANQLTCIVSYFAADADGKLSCQSLATVSVSLDDELPPRVAPLGDEPHQQLNAVLLSQQQVPDGSLHLAVVTSASDDAPKRGRDGEVVQRCGVEVQLWQLGAEWPERQPGVLLGKQTGGFYCIGTTMAPSFRLAV